MSDDLLEETLVRVRAYNRALNAAIGEAEFLRAQLLRASCNGQPLDSETHLATNVLKALRRSTKGEEERLARLLMGRKQIGLPFDAAPQQEIVKDGRQENVDGQTDLR